jgi:hypothetical protein
MTISIEDPEVDRLAQRLSRLTGQSPTEGIADLTALPVADSRSPDELIGYDEWGLPAR